MKVNWSPASLDAGLLSPPVESSQEMTTIVESIRDEFLRYKALAEAAIAQLGGADLSAAGPNHGNSIAIICWHLSGNLRSRFTDFLTADGEKPWRKRDEEFESRTVTREELIAKWNDYSVTFHQFSLKQV